MELYGAHFRYVEKKRVRMEEEVREEVGNEFIDLAQVHALGVDRFQHQPSRCARFQHDDGNIHFLGAVGHRNYSALASLPEKVSSTLHVEMCRVILRVSTHGAFRGDFVRPLRHGCLVVSFLEHSRNHEGPQPRFCNSVNGNGWRSEYWERKKDSIYECEPTLQETLMDRRAYRFLEKCSSTSHVVNGCGFVDQAQHVAVVGEFREDEDPDSWAVVFSISV
jgi:hypothetical protein